MKIKSDFVTNSSSTSFVVAHFDRTKALGKIKIELEIDLDNFMDYKGRRIQTIKELHEHFEWYPPEDLEKLENIIKNDGEILDIHVSNDDSDDFIELYLLKNGINEKMFDTTNFEIIKGEGGY
mgnify:CR=1 FL=1